MNVMIRKEEEKDYERVYEIHLLACKQENEGKLIEKIRLGDDFIPALSLVAEMDDKMVGHILFSKVRIIGDSVFETLALAPMSVIPEYQKKGIGSLLIMSGIMFAKELGFDSIFVLDYEDYYTKFGFQKVSNWNIKCPFRVPDEGFMAIELINDSLKNITGTIEYPDEFKNFNRIKKLLYDSQT